MCASPLDFRLGVLSVAGVESVLAALHQHGEYDSEHLDATLSLFCPTLLMQHYVLRSVFTWICTALLMTRLCWQAVCYSECGATLA